ncbi:MAG: hypothetical protein L6R36_006702 [Xanthoria steineri]|nr:MAG: hypothetical protein L6R36_006702 [Xanthoria steineri]
MLSPDLVVFRLLILRQIPLKSRMTLRPVAKARARVLQIIPQAQRASPPRELHHIHLLARPELVLPLPQLLTLDRHLLRMIFSRAMNLNQKPNVKGGKNAKIHDAIQNRYAKSTATDGTRFFGSKSENPFDSNAGLGSIDHVWEKSNVGDLLGSLLGSYFDCDDMNSLFSACGVRAVKDL